MILTANIGSVLYTVSAEPFQIPVMIQHSDTLFTFSAFNTEVTISLIVADIVNHFGIPMLPPKDLIHVQGLHGKPVSEEAITPQTSNVCQN